MMKKNEISLQVYFLKICFIVYSSTAHIRKYCEVKYSFLMKLNTISHRLIEMLLGRECIDAVVGGDYFSLFNLFIVIDGEFLGCKRIAMWGNDHLNRIAKK